MNDNERKLLSQDVFIGPYSNKANDKAGGQGGIPPRIKPKPNISSLTLVLTTPDTSVSEKKLRKLSTPECAKYNASGQSATKSQKVESKRIPDVKGNKIK